MRYCESTTTQNKKAVKYMTIKSQVSVLLDKKMDRADFLKHIAIGVLALTGIAGMLRALGISQPQGGAQSYGSSTYGGMKRD